MGVVGALALINLLVKRLFLEMGLSMLSSLQTVLSA
jgi:hypothetical protein